MPSPASELLSHKRRGRARGTELLVEEPPTSLNNVVYTTEYCWSCHFRTCTWNKTSFAAHGATRYRGYRRYISISIVLIRALVSKNHVVWKRYQTEQSCRRNETTSQSLSANPPHPQACVSVLHRDLDQDIHDMSGRVYNPDGSITD